MTPATSESPSRLLVAVWLVGLGVLYASKRFWPGILFLAGATALIQAYYYPERRNTGRFGVFMILLGLWAMLRLSLPFLLIGLGVYLIFSSLSSMGAGRKPHVDQTLD
ncbi:hypothetical protein [Paludisphaera rhizosphaerae]|uniref:hypothetical protein n=1 Tax=Paludisphaera rhizosphaerae TaxID=2711216 RepID=UPI0013EC58DB|nr:hypothetical protein [Paludisphaera rhizosphaerae]